MTGRCLVLLSLACVLGRDALVGADAGRRRVLIGLEDSARINLAREVAGIRYQYRLVKAFAAEVTSAQLSELTRREGVVYVESDPQAAVIQGDAIPWGIQATGAPWAISQGTLGQGVRVAVVDTGVDYRHPDLKARYRGGHDFVDGDTAPLDEHGHGTHCAGIIAASRDGKGLVGIAPGVDLYAVRVMNRSGKGYYSDVIAGIEWAIQNGMNVISLSVGSHQPSRTLEAMCAAAEKAGVVLVAAAGNDGKRSVMFPARYASTVAVSALDPDGKVAAYSNYGPEIDFAAPGTFITSTVRKGFATFWGTSMACPHVSGAAALVISSPPGSYDRDGDGKWSPEEVRACLAANAQDRGPEGKDEKYGYGIIDVSAALARPELHEVRIDRVTVPPRLRAGVPLRIQVSLTNAGEQSEDVTVQLVDETYDTPMAARQVKLRPGKSLTVHFEFPTTASAKGDHLLRVEAVVGMGQRTLVAAKETRTVTVL